MQAENESFNSYFAALRELAATCSFGPPPPPAQIQLLQPNLRMILTNVLTRNYVIKIIQGIRDKAVQNYYLSTPDLTLKQVCDRALAVELSSQGFNSQSSAGAKEPSVNKVNDRVRQKRSNPPKLEMRAKVVF
ncbi:hypothetical protein U1Q18_046290 [Sarracenia purpurea var. burkii]